MSLFKFESMLKTNNVFFFDATEFEEIIQHYLSISKLALAKKGIQLGLEQHPASVSLKLLKVELFVFEDNLVEAIELLSEIEALEPNNDEVFIQKATISSKKRKHKEAIEFLEKALDFTQDPFDIWALIGMEFLYLDDYENARLNFAKCIEEDYEDYSSLYNIVYCFEMQENYKGAASYLTSFLEMNPYSEVGWHQLGRQHFELKMYKEALSAFDYAILIDDNFIGGYLEKAKTLEKLERFEEAIGNYLITINLDDPTAYVYIRIGECYEKLKNFETAIKYYEKAVHEDPLLDRGWILLSDAYYEEGNFHKAVYYINKALQIDDLNILFWRKYAEINMKLNFHEEAVKAFYKCLELGDETINLYIALADVLLFLGDFDDALSVLNETKKTYNELFSEIEYRLTGLYFILNKKEDSYKCLENGLKLDFEYHNIIKDLYPTVFESYEVKTIIKNFKEVINKN